MAKVYESSVYPACGKPQFGEYQVGESVLIPEFTCLNDWLSECGELCTVCHTEELDGRIQGQNGRPVYRLETSYGEVSYHIVEVVE